VIIELREGDDSVQEITVKLKVWSSISRVPCNSGGMRLELDDPSVVCWTRRSAEAQRDLGGGDLTTAFRLTRWSDGEAGRAGVLWFIGNSISEILLRVVRSGHSRIPCSGAQSRMKPCQ
jgi:hypothetical protein